MPKTPRLVSDAELARILQEEEEEISRQDRNRRRANNRIDEDANFAAALVSLDEDELLKSPEESADEDFLLAWQLQEHETQAARIRAQQQHQTQLRHSLSPTHKYEKGSRCLIASRFGVGFFFNPDTPPMQLFRNIEIRLRWMCTMPAKIIIRIIVISTI